jgi:hypothetical protein
MDVVDHPDRQFGQFYPEEDVLAVIPDVESGGPVRDVLERAGIPSDEIRVVAGDKFAPAMRGMREDRNLVEKVISFHTRELDALMDRYVDHAEEGRAIVVVRAEDDERTELVGRILAEHGAEMVHHYGKYSVRRLN